MNIFILIVSVGALISSALSLLLAVSAGIAAQRCKESLSHKLSNVLLRQNEEIAAVNNAANAARTVLTTLKAFDFSEIEKAIDQVIDARVQAKFKEIQN